MRYYKGQAGVYWRVTWRLWESAAEEILKAGGPAGRLLPHARGEVVGRHADMQ